MLRSCAWDWVPLVLSVESATLALTLLRCSVIRTSMIVKLNIGVTATATVTRTTSVYTIVVESIRVAGTLPLVLM